MSPLYFKPTFWEGYCLSLYPMDLGLCLAYPLYLLKIVFPYKNILSLKTIMHIVEWRKFATKVNF
jgi:hypothetical protein